MVALGDVGDTGADLDHDAGALVAADHRQLHRHVTGDQVVVGMAQAAGGQLHQHFAVLGAVEVDLFDLPLLVQTPQHPGAGLHADFSGVQVAGRLLMPLMKLAIWKSGWGALMSGMRV